MKVFVQLAAVGLASLMFSACGIRNQQENRSGAETPAQAFTFSEGQQSVRFVASQDQNKSTFVEISINQKVFTARVSSSTGNGEIIANNQELTESEKSLLKKAMADIVGDESRSQLPPERELLVTYIDMLASSPKDFKHENRQLAGISLVENDTRCIKKDKLVLAEWETSAKGYQSEIMKVNSHQASQECIGRCGQGCGKWWIPSSYTKDCLNLDACLLKSKNDPGSCRQEFERAQDDWILGVTIGCWG